MSRIDARYPTFAKVSLTLCAAVLPMVVGLGLTLDLAKRSLQSENSRVGQAAVAKLDHILNQASSTAQEVMAHAGQPCEVAHNLLHQRKAANPWLAAISLNDAGTPYCTTLDCTGTPLREWQTPTLASPSHSGLRLEVTNGQGYLVLSAEKDTQGVSVMLDNRLILQQLELISGTVEVALKVNDVFLWDDGSTLHGELKEDRGYHALTSSPGYGYTIYSSVSGEDVLRLVTNRVITVLGPISMLSIISAGLCYWALTRPRRFKAQ
ncbi:MULTISPECIES: CSS-motif domain-containing protein [Pseudomonas]|uniref:Putative cyclic diguanylate phosphodiesterase CSS motif-containing domain-containing protein n=1 Tax=Pseudomonas quercus TaxID=2722792 RepID=A0ABX0Y8R3_9PSED|nr:MULTISPECIES: CSS-motif domain-containing protein [Pseudomonas]MBF7141178.1 CSS-motif domain-containing protein [Pseudomonas sp. LY10J]NJO99712.1 hypothetical protein [Pseudomonas quercus]